MLSGLQGQDSPASPVSLELVLQWPWHHFSSFRNVESKNSLGPSRLSSSKQDQVQLMSVSTGPGAQHRTAVKRMQRVAGKDHVVWTPQVWVLLPGSAIYNLRGLFTSLNLNFTCCKNRSSLSSSVQSLSRVQVFATPWTAARQASLSITNSRSLLKLMSIESVMSSNHLILCHPLLLLPSIFPSTRVFSNESVFHTR